MYGTFHPASGVYRACASPREGDDPGALGLETWTIPGGRYSKRVVKPFDGNYTVIGPTFEQMAARADYDPTRPSVEFYRRMDELVLLLPVK